MHLPDDCILKQIQIGPWKNYIYFIGDAKTKEIAVVDPAWEADTICLKAEEYGLKISSVLLTHGHTDHVNALDPFLEKHNVPAYISKNEHMMYKPTHKNIVEIEDHQKIQIGNIEIECILTPGHTPGSQCFKYNNILLTGDTLFINGCGRCDLPGGDPNTMYHTLYDIIKKLPDDTVIYSGHQYGSVAFDTLKSQFKSNPYLNCSSKEEFLSTRM